MNKTTYVKPLYHRFYGLARIYWRDMQCSGLDAIEKSKRRAYEVAAQRVGFPLSLCDRLFATCFDERLVPNGHMFEMSDHISTCVDLTYKPPMYQPTMRDRPFVLLDPFDKEEVAEHDVESGMAVMFWADDVRLVYNSVTYGPVMTKDQFEALLAESVSWELEDAKGQDTPEGDRRLLEIDALMEASPWVFDMDEGVVPKAPLK